VEALSRRLCDAVGALRYEDLPPAVIATVKRLILDALGVIGGAAHAPGIPELHARLARWERSGAATALLGARRLSPPTAALANGAAAHALDFDDLHDPARVHTSCIVLPTVLATAEDLGSVSGKQFILAMAIGAEVHARLGLACHSSLSHGWHPTMVLGTLAASLAAGKLLALDAEGLGNALGLAFHQASGSAQSMHDGVLAKRLGAGFAARGAVLAAFLARDGLTGTRRTLEGDAGLFALYERGEVAPEFLLDGWRETWRIPEYSFKPYPGCRCNHTAIGLGIRLHREGVRAAEVAGIEIGLGNVNWRTVGQPYDASLKSVVHAQFNVAYSFARALLDGKVDLATYDEGAIVDPRAVALAAATRVLDDPGIDPRAIAPARVALRLRDGRTIDASSATIKGSPEEAISDAELEEKLAGCLAFGLGASRAKARRVKEVVHDLENAPQAAQSLLQSFPAVTSKAHTRRPYAM
jgi:2-methylcitrate dehydratase PrpD